MMIEVRCCCTPTKLLGWLPIGEPAYLPSRVTFRYAELGDGSPLVLDPDRMNEELVGVVEVRLTLPVAYFGSGIASRPALKSEETPIEALRKIRGFVENGDRGNVWALPPFPLEELVS